MLPSLHIQAINFNFAKISFLLQALERHVDSLDWITLLILGIMVLLVSVKATYPQRFQDFTSLLTTGKFMAFRGKENKAFHAFNILMFGVHLFSVSLFLFVTYKTFFEANPAQPQILFIRIATAYGSFVLLKAGIEKIIGDIFNLDPQIDYYVFQKLSYRNFMALFLLVPGLLFTYAFSPTKILVGSLIILLVLFNILSLFLIFKQNQNLIARHWFYFILYLCALEIAPYIILYKLFTIY